MAEVVFRALVERAGMTGRVEVDSAEGRGTGTSATEPDRPVPSRRPRRRRLRPGRTHRARQFDAAWFAERDLVVALDAGHLRALRRLRDAGRSTEIRLLRSFDPASGADLDVPDPYYGDRSAFTTCSSRSSAPAEGLLAHVRDELAARPA